MENGQIQQASRSFGIARTVECGQPYRSHHRRCPWLAVLIACIGLPGLAHAQPFQHPSATSRAAGLPAAASTPVPHPAPPAIYRSFDGFSLETEKDPFYLGATLLNDEELPSQENASEPPGSIFEDGDRFDLLFYGGKFVDVTFRRVVFRQITDYRDSYIWVTALNYQLGNLLGPIDIETEAQIAKHTGLQNHLEANVLILARLQVLLWGSFSISMAFGDGFSIASKVPMLEEEENPDSKVFLQYLLAELVFGFPGISGHPRFMIRVHHRSGVFGLFCEETCGSNFVTYGIKVEF